MKPKAEGPSTPKDPDRFYCPFPGCNRSFAELWRLKVHYRAPPDIRGSGKERGHGTELTHCPKCGKNLKPGKHHVGCSAGKTAPRQATRRARTSNETGDDEVPDIADTPFVGDFHEHQHNFDLSHLTTRAQGVSWQEFGPCYLAPAPVPVPTAAQMSTDPRGQDGSGLRQPSTFMSGNPLIEQSHPSYQTVPQYPPCHLGPAMPSTSFYSFPDAQASCLLPTGVGPMSPLHTVFDYDHMDFSRIPSPPPLPPDFQASTSTGALLFNFKQFSEKLPSSSSQSCKPIADLSGSLNCMTEPNVVYDQSEDGDLMQLLIGLPDELPTMATIHLHQWHEDCDPDSKTQNFSQQRSGVKEEAACSAQLDAAGGKLSFLDLDSPPNGRSDGSSSMLQFQGGASTVQYGNSSLNFDRYFNGGLESALDGLRVQNGAVQ